MYKVQTFIVIVGIAVLSLLSVASIYGNDKTPEELFDKARQAPKEEAIGIYQGIIEEYPGTKDAARAQRSMGTLYFRQKKYEQAIKAYQTYIDNYPEEGPERIAIIYSAIATVYEEMSDFDTAKKIYGKIINEYPDTRAALTSRKWLAKLNDPEFIKNLKIAEQHMKVLGPIAHLYSKGEYDQAIVKAKEVLKTQDDPEIILSVHLIIARSYAKLERQSKAIKEYKTIIRLAPESEIAREARERIKELESKSKK
jgi:tetratricopeptide (TPR) repeat protein